MASLGYQLCVTIRSGVRLVLSMAPEGSALRSCAFCGPLAVSAGVFFSVVLFSEYFFKQDENIEFSPFLWAHKPCWDLFVHCLN